MGQKIILIKELPSKDYLPDLVRTGVLRAAMTFQPGSCYAGAGIYPETVMYAMSTSGEADADAVATDACPYPGDVVRCAQWEIEQGLARYSLSAPQEFNAFVFAQVRSGYRAEWGTHAEEVARELEQEAKRLIEKGVLLRPEYVAVAHLIGCGPYNVGFEILTSDHNRLQAAIRRLTDKEYVEDVMVGHLAAEDALGFGEGGTASAQ